MRSQTEYIITKSEVHAYAEDWLGTALRLEYQGYKCSTSVLLNILLIAAARVVSLFAACRSLADAPTDQNHSQCPGRPPCRKCANGNAA